jgi:hypothetical protein
MPVTNNNLRLVDRPVWEQLTPGPANSAAGATFADDNERYVYYLISATAFWRYDTWADAWQQLANPTGGTVGAGTTLRYSKQIGTQFNGVVYGSVFALITSGTGAPVFNRYDIATNAWTALSVASLPGTFGTDGKLVIPEPFYNGYVGGYHSGVLQTVTASANALVGATSISVSATSAALPSGAILNFGTYAAPILAVLTASATAGATSLTVSALVAQVNSAATALYYDHGYLIGNNATQMYRYTITTNAWSTTSANGGTPALPAVTAAPGAGLSLKWLPGSSFANALNSLFCVRGAASASIYQYRLDTNAWSTITFHPATETFTTGTTYGVRTDSNGRPTKFLVSKEVTNRVYEFDPVTSRMSQVATQWLLAQGAALVGDRSFVIKSPDGIEFFYMMLSTSTSFVRTPLFF